MKRSRSPVTQLGLGLGFATIALTGCTGTGATPETLEPAEVESSTSTKSPGRSIPAARVGGLGREDLPRPSVLGKEWRYRIDPGDPEEGYRGSGEPAIARDPTSVLDAITPLG